MLSRESQVRFDFSSLITYFVRKYGEESSQNYGMSQKILQSQEIVETDSPTLMPFKYCLLA